MSSWREIERFRKDADDCRDLARRLLKLEPNQWEVGFLESIAGRWWIEEFTTRQCEKLLQIRDGLRWTDTVRGFSVKLLIKGCYEARADLTEQDEEWLCGLLGAFNGTRIRARDSGRLLRCSRQLGLVD